MQSQTMMRDPQASSWSRLQVALIAQGRGRPRPTPFRDLFLVRVDEEHADGDRTYCQRPPVWYLALSPGAPPNVSDAAFCGSCGRRLSWRPAPDGSLFAAPDWWTAKQFERWWCSTGPAGIGRPREATGGLR
jgi:hypothetical protein